VYGGWQLLERIQRKQKQLREEDEVGVGGGGVMEEEEPTQPRYQPPSRQSPKTTPGPSQSTEHQAEVRLSTHSQPARPPANT
jgi:hypothetical protein